MRRLGTQSATLWGREHTQVAGSRITGVGDTVAVGIARGWRPKPYWYLDPNEDVVAAVVGPRATLLVVADGHTGLESSHAAVAAVLEFFGDDPPPADLTETELLDVYVVALHAVQSATAHQLSPRDDSRTTLVVALLAENWLQWCALGDSSLFLLAPDAGGLELTEPRHAFVGTPLTPAQLDLHLSRGSYAVPRGSWVVLTSDGYTNFLPRTAVPAEATSIFVRDLENPVEVVETLLRRARAGGAGDNVAVAVAGPVRPA